MQFSTRKQMLMVIIGLVALIGLGVFSWGFKTGKIKLLASTTQTFSDVSPSYWAYAQIEAAAKAGIVQGYPGGTFKPEDIVTRDQGAVFIARAVAGGDANVPNYTGTAHCNDVPSSNWAYKYIEYLFSHGIVTQDSNPLGRCVQTDTYHGYKPTDPLVRGDMAVYLARAKAGGDSKVPAGPTTPSFKDIPATSLYYKYVEYGKAQGIFKGYPDGTYQPAGTVTRAQLSVYMANYLGLQQPTSPSPGIPPIADQSANISGQVTDSTGAALANGYLVIDENILIKIDANGNYNLPGFNVSLHQVSIYDQRGVQYEAKNPDGTTNAFGQLMSPVLGNQQINFSGLKKK